jgi:predicted alpha/beta hydrolase family esterase
MKKIYIVHRWEGGSLDDWRPWLKTELEKKGYEVFVPDMPDTEVPVIEKWVNKLSEVVGTPDSETYFIGHSIGCQTILRYLQTINTKVGGALFVAGWFNLENLEDEEVVEIARPWIETLVDIEKIKDVLPKSILLISKDDPYGAFEENVEKFGQFVTHSCVFDHAGHFTEEEQPEIVGQFENLIQEH